MKEHQDFPEPTLDLIKTQVEIDKMRAEIAKLGADTMKINRENQWLPFVWATGFVTAVIALTKLFL